LKDSVALWHPVYIVSIYIYIYPIYIYISNLYIYHDFFLSLLSDGVW